MDFVTKSGCWTFYDLRKSRRVARLASIFKGREEESVPQKKIQ